MTLARPCSVDAALCRSLPPVLFSHIPYLVPYSLGLALQEHLVSRRAHARANLRSPNAADADHLRRVAKTDTLLLLQHRAVYTDGRRADSVGGGPGAEAQQAEVERLRCLKADYATTRRGGLVTYHGPGQLTGYPIWDIGAMDVSLQGGGCDCVTLMLPPLLQLQTRTYVNLLEHSLRSCISSSPYLLPTLLSPPGGTGVWTSPTRKIASIGIQVRHRITSHGFALNVTDVALRGFAHIVACGLEGVEMVGVQGEVKRAGDETLSPQVAIDSIVPHIVKHMGDVFEREMTEAPEEHLRYEADRAGVLEKVWVAGEQVRE